MQKKRCSLMQGSAKAFIKHLPQTKKNAAPGICRRIALWLIAPSRTAKRPGKHQHKLRYSEANRSET